MLTYRLLLAASLWVIVAFPVQATLLEISPELPMTEYGSLAGQGIQYNAATGSFTATGLPLSVQFTTLGSKQLVTGDAGMAINIQVTSGGVASSGDAAHDFALWGNVSDGTTNYTGTLLTGTLLDFGFLDASIIVDAFDFLFDVTGGSMAGLFGSGQIGVIMIAERSTFMDFTQNFASTRIKGTIGRVPEPATLWLAGLALGAIGVMRRRA
jgi:hypothetical protein